MRGFQSGSNLTPADYQSIVGRYAGAQAGADRTVNDIFNGGTTNKLLSNFRPVAAARTAYTREAAVNALNKTLNDIEATQSRKGFVGDTSGNRLLRYNANKDAAQATAAVGLQNATEEQGIRNRGDVELPLQSLNLPYAQAQRAVDTFNLPQNAYLDQLARRLQPLSFLNIHTSAPFQYQPMPTVQPIASPFQLALQGGAGAGNAVLDMYLKQRSAQQYRDAAANNYYSRAPYGTYRDSGANQAATDYMMNGPDYGTTAAAGAGEGAAAADDIDWASVFGE